MLRGGNQMAAASPVRRKEGSVFYADINSAPIRLSGNNCLVGMFRDIAQRNRGKLPC